MGKLAAGASGRNAGFVLTAQRETYPDLIARVGRAAAHEIFRMVRDNVRRMRELAADGISVEFTQDDLFHAGFVASMRVADDFVV